MRKLVDAHLELSARLEPLRRELARDPGGVDALPAGVDRPRRLPDRLRYQDLVRVDLGALLAGRDLGLGVLRLRRGIPERIGHVEPEAPIAVVPAEKRVDRVPESAGNDAAR
jgi:hypothetical protein